MADAPDMTPNASGDYDPDETLRPEWTADGHLDEGTVHAWLDGAFDAASASQVEAHVDGCAQCRAMVAEARGLIAGASRITRALDAVPNEVVPADDVARAASRIVAQMEIPAAAMTLGRIAEPAQAYASARSPSATLTNDDSPAFTTSTRAWYQSRLWRAAAAIVIVVGGSTYVLRDRGTPSVASFTRDTAVTESVTREAAKTVAAAASAPNADRATGARQREASPPPAETRRNARVAAKRESANDANAKDANAKRGISESTSAPASAPMPVAVTTAASAAPLAVPPARVVDSLASRKSALDSTARGVLADSRAGASATPAPPSSPTSATVRVTGVVRDQRGKPIEGVAVALAGTTNQVMTNARGEFALGMSGDSGTIMMRRLGYQAERVPVRAARLDSTVVQLAMKESVQSLAAVTVASESAARRGARAIAADTLVQTRLGLPSCWRVTSAASSSLEELNAELPHYIHIPAARLTSTLDTRWVDWPRIGDATAVSMSLDNSSALSGRSVVDGKSLQLVLTATSNGWRGAATLQVGAQRFVGALTLTTAQPAMCTP